MMRKDSQRSDTLRLYTLHSQKGGVGKTSLAIAIAGLESIARQSKTLLIDTDLTGTSLADALDPQSAIASSPRPVALANRTTDNNSTP